MTISYICEDGHLTVLEVDRVADLSTQTICHECGEVATWDECSISEEEGHDA